MMNKNILFVHTTGDWWESRYQYKQIPALKKAGYNVIHLIKDQDTSACIDCSFLKVSSKNIRISGGLVLLFKILKVKSKIIQICNIETLPLGIILSVFFRKKVFYDCIEDHYSSILFNKTYYSKLLRIIIAQFVLMLEIIAQRTFVGIITSDPFIFRSHKLMPNYKKILFYNMPSLRDFNSFTRTKAKKFDLVVLGSMSIRTGVLDVINSIIELKKENIFVSLKLIGNPFQDKDLEVEIKKILAESNVSDQIEITGKIPFYQVPLELSTCMIGIIPLLNFPKFQNNIAMKQWEYWAMGMPVIASKLIPQQYFIRDGFNGLLYEPGNIEDLKLKIKQLLKNQNQIRQLGENGRKKFEAEWNSESQERKYVNFYDLRLNNLKYFETELPPIKI